MNRPLCKVFIASSLDGYIADADGGIEWLETFPEINTIDSGFHGFMAGVDALLMGRSTFEKVLSFGIDWPYVKPVHVWSRTMHQIPDGYEEKAEIEDGIATQILDKFSGLGYQSIYVDGGRTIQSFLHQDLIDEIIITTIPVLLGGGAPLFSDLTSQLVFECVETKLYLNKIVQNRYLRKRV